MIIAVSITVCCVVVALVCTVVCAIKCHKREPSRPPPTNALTRNQQEPVKQQVNDFDQYKSLLQYKRPESYHHHWNTASRSNHGPDVGTVQRQTYDRHCSTLPWPKQCTNENNTSQMDGHSTLDNKECPKYFILDKELVNKQIN